MATNEKSLTTKTTKQNQDQVDFSSPRNMIIFSFLPVSTNHCFLTPIYKKNANLDDWWDSLLFLSKEGNCALQVVDAEFLFLPLLIYALGSFDIKLGRLIYDLWNYYPRFLIWTFPLLFSYSFPHYYMLFYSDQHAHLNCYTQYFDHCILRLSLSICICTLDKSERISAYVRHWQPAQ